MYLFRFLTVWMYFKTNVTMNSILELSFDTKKRNTHLAYLHICRHRKLYDSFTLVKSILVMVHIMHLGSGFSLHVLIKMLAHPPGQNYFMSFL